MSQATPPIRTPNREAVPPPPAHGHPVRRQFVSFGFYQLLPEFRRLPLDQQAAMLGRWPISSRPTTAGR